MRSTFGPRTAGLIAHNFGYLTVLVLALIVNAIGIVTVYRHFGGEPATEPEVPSSLVNPALGAESLQI